VIQDPPAAGAAEPSKYSENGPLLDDISPMHIPLMEYTKPLSPSLSCPPGSLHTPQPISQNVQLVHADIHSTLPYQISTFSELSDALITPSSPSKRIPVYLRRQWDFEAPIDPPLAPYNPYLHASPFSTLSNALE